MKLNIVQRFSLLSIATTLAVSGSLGLVVSGILSRSLLRQEAEMTAGALRTVTNIDLTQEAFNRALIAREPAPFQYVWSHFLEIPEVFRIKIYDTDGTIAWSNEAQLIGRNYGDNKGLRRALGGEVVAEMAEVKAEHEYERRLAPEKETLELYLPLISRRNGRPYAVVEVYKHPRGFLAHRRFWLGTVWLASLGGGLLLFLSLFGFFRGAFREQLRLQGMERRYAQMNLEMKLAASIQKGLLPAALPEVPGFALAAMHLPSADIGGDFYDVFGLADGGVALVVADSEGKGVPGALLMMRTHSVLHAHAGGPFDPRAVIEGVNRILASEERVERFVTMFLARLDPRQRAITYCNAGHCPALHVRGGTATALEAGGIPLGIEANASYEDGSARLAPGDVFFAYTDGLTETFNPQGEVFGVERLRAVLAGAARSADPDAILREVGDEVVRFRAGRELRDDMVMLCLVARGETA